MRGVGIVACCVGVALLVSGCDTTDSRYFRYGIGTDLYSADIVEATQYQDIYLTELCRQALPMVSTSDGLCLNAAFGPNDWNLLVQAGLNDVDRRCDSYLAWLDDRRRTNGAVLKELGDLTVASQAIMRVAGVSANPITLAGLAFGLAANTFTNINSRLLLEVDKTTVQTLVLRRRNGFRLDLQSIVITNKPAAIHALRSYLNICTPFAIETDINSTITVFQVAGAGALTGPPLISAETVRTGVIADVRRQLPAEGFHPNVDRKKLFDSQLDGSLCVLQTQQPRELAIRDYLVGQNQLQDPSATSVTLTPALRRLLTRAVDRVPDCNAAGFENAFEVGRYGVFDPKKRKANINSLQEALRAKLNLSSTDLPDSDDISQKTRDAIEKFRIDNNAEKGLKGQVTNQLLVDLRKPASQ